MRGERARAGGPAGPLGPRPAGAQARASEGAAAGGPAADHAEVLARARAGDRASIERLLLAYQPDVRRFARRVCRVEDADDAVQHALVQLATKLGAFREAARLTSWLFTIVKRECLRLLGRLRREGEGGLEPPPSGATDAELRLSLLRALAGLDDAHRDVLLLRDVEQRPGPEVAEALGISVEAMKSRLHRAREQVRAELAPPGGGEALGRRDDDRA
ncbi:MAG TPA: RNA polymerase sigma factor [Polyangiaceae bacterium]|nr:RNA polymerase sigma factor [Polyangiaceae bacterium]